MTTNFLPNVFVSTQWKQLSNKEQEQFAQVFIEKALSSESNMDEQVQDLMD